MSSTLETLQKQIASGEDLSSIVRTMKALAATSVRQYEKAAESLDDYYHTVELGLSVVLASAEQAFSAPSPDSESAVSMLVFGSDHGLAGRFNEQIVSYALESKGPDQWSGLDEASRVYTGIGEQVVSRLSAAGAAMPEQFNMPSSISAITPFTQLLLETIDARRRQEGSVRVLLFYNRPHAGGFSPQSEILLPVDLKRLRQASVAWQSRSLPTYSMASEQLLSALLRQYFFVSLYRACALSLAAENTSRLAAMQAAEKNINERLDQLKTLFQQERQAAITEELLDIISGFKAVKSSVD